MSARNFSDSHKVVSLFDAQSIAYNGTITGDEVDARGFRWAYFVFHTTQGSTAIDAQSTFTVTSAAASGGSFTTVTDDTSNMTDGASADVTAVATTTTGTTDDASETQFAEIDLEQHEGFLKVNVAGGGSSAGAAVFSGFVVLSEARNTGTDVSNTLEFEIHTKNKSAW